MNGIGIGLLCVAVQTTLLAGLVLLLYRLLCRKNPLSGGVVLAGFMGLLLLLPIAALLPLPAWWSAGDIPENSMTMPEVTETTGPDSGFANSAQAEPRFCNEPTEVGIAFSPRSLWQSFSRHVQQARAEQSYGLEFTAMAFLAGCLFHLIRLQLGLVAVRQLRNSSKLLGEDSLRELLNHLQKQLGVHKPVELRESNQIATAATVGWRRPVILLAPCWRLWSPAEQKAVLAHELAHVRRRDYLLWLLARFGTALHFYHPLVRWLVSRLRLHQELAADSLAAPVAGGRRCYLLALSRLALRADDQPCGGLAQAFLPAPGTLMRRIQMLQVPEGRRKSLSRLSQLVALCLLFGAALAVTALRHPTSLGGEEQAAQADNTEVAAGKNSSPEPKPFDLTYLPQNVQGVFVVRPEVLFGRPDMKKIAKALDGVLRRGSKEFGLKSGLGLPVSEIEQLLCPIHIQHRKEAPEGQKGQLSFSLTAIRARKKYDWVKQINKTFPNLTEVKYQGKAYWKISDANPMLFIFGKCLYIPDNRTLVISSHEDHVRNLIDGKTVSPKIPHWDKVKTQDMAIWFTLPKEVKKYLADTKTPDPELAFLKHIDFLTAGFNFRKDFNWQGFSDFGTPKAAIKAETVLREHLAESKREVTKLLNQIKDLPEDDTQKYYKIGLDLLQPEIRRTGITLQASGSANSPFALLMGAFLADNKISLEE